MTTSSAGAAQLPVDRASIEHRLITVRKSVGQLDSLGALDSARLATALAPPDGPHHVLVQLCLDTEPEKVPAIVEAAWSRYREYVRQLSDWITADERVRSAIPVR
ncbi:hypothetical protein SAMN05216489_09535 [Streptomyces sp. 3213]|uniref:hypothetical protein n=1 Tax=Streptomyces sp. 3213.3 TaxID=1855348 RepID=UPI0008978870|nr:hypothetical protein [Streptomyces sp. 3213.3]SEF00435.1 hypothetical protein SAMN05216489_09535 [Streptomyces sp. 3213] [Streptomyces sp. 3213.3]